MQVLMSSTPVYMHSKCGEVMTLNTYGMRQKSVLTFPQYMKNTVDSTLQMHSTYVRTYVVRYGVCSMPVQYSTLQYSKLTVVTVCVYQ